MFDRIVAWAHAKDMTNPIYRVLAATEEYSHCTDQRLTNFELDFQYCEGWVKRNRHLKKEREALLEHDSIKYSAGIQLLIDSLVEMTGAGRDSSRSRAPNRLHSSNSRTFSSKAFATSIFPIWL